MRGRTIWRQSQHFWRNGTWGQYSRHSENWIIGNEVNVRSTWNYMKYIDIVPYAREYAQAGKTVL